MRSEMSAKQDTVNLCIDPINIDEVFKYSVAESIIEFVFLLYSVSTKKRPP